MQLGLKGKVALVTGASRGIGKAVATELAQEGCNLLIVARSADLLVEVATATAKSAGVQVVTWAGDLAQPDAAERAVQQARSAFGRLDILVNNAGATKRGDFFSLSEADWTDGFALKFFGYVRLTRAAWPLLRQAQGKVINIVGVGGRTPGAEFTIGGSVNAAVLSFSKAMADVGLRDGVSVNVVNPGPIETERLMNWAKALAERENISLDDAKQRMQRQAGLPRFGQPGEVAALVAYLAGERAGFIQGALIDIDGGQTKTL